MVQTGEPVFVQAFVPEAPVKRFDVSVLIRLARLNEEQLNTPSVRPIQHRPAAELLAVIRPDRFGQAPCLRQLVENARLKKLLAETMLENEITKEALRKKW